MRLADGNEMPMLGLGVWQVPDGPECVDAVRSAGVPLHRGEAGDRLAHSVRRAIGAISSD
jgi:hypothetical protein